MNEVIKCFTTNAMIKFIKEGVCSPFALEKSNYCDTEVEIRIIEPAYEYKVLYLYRVDRPNLKFIKLVEETKREVRNEN